MKKGCKFYGVYAKNGLGIYRNPDRLADAEMFMRGEHIEGFSSKEEALEFAQMGFASLYGVDCLHEVLPAHDLWVNWFYYYKGNKRY